MTAGWSTSGVAPTGALWRPDVANSRTDAPTARVRTKRDGATRDRSPTNTCTSPGHPWMNRGEAAHQRTRMGTPDGLHPPGRATLRRPLRAGTVSHQAEPTGAACCVTVRCSRTYASETRAFHANQVNLPVGVLSKAGSAPPPAVGSGGEVPPWCGSGTHATPSHPGPDPPPGGSCSRSSRA